MKTVYADNIKLADVLNREIQTYGEYERIVRDIIARVKQDGDSALFEFAKQYDKVELNALEVSAQEIDEAFAALDNNFVKVLEQAAENIEFFHKMQVREGFRVQKDSGVVLGQKFTPIERAGVYVPGGTASYPSTVLMDAIPAKIAGVKEIIMTTPPMRDGKIKAEILVAAKIAGVSRIFKIGGAGAIAALAYGTQSVPRVDKIVGPGNIFVALAKKEVFGTVGIDMIAGPSEILIVADENANPVSVAADLLSQAEHDKLATAVLVTPSTALAQAVSDEVERQLKLLPREEIARTSIDNSGKIIIVKDISQAVEIANAIAPEHLELCVENPFELLDSIKNAGSIFLGYNTPEALGDYYAGPNHTLPTSGSARFSSPLGVDDFVKKSSYIYYPSEELARVKDDVAEFAEREGLHAHAQSVTVRFEEDRK